MKFKLNDRKLTAYVLGELSEKKRRAVEKELARDPAARRTVEELRATADLTGRALKSAPLHAFALSPAQRERIKERLGEIDEMTPEPDLKPSRVRIFAATSIFNRPLPAAVGGFVLAMISMAVLWYALTSIYAPLELFCLKSLPEQNFRPSTGLWKVKGVKTMYFGGEGDSDAYYAVPADIPFPGDISAQGGGWEDDPRLVYWPGHDTEAYDNITDNPFLSVKQNPLSTFSIDVDTAAYANVRRFLNQGELPPKDAVRIEEMINYFSYDYAPPEGDIPFSASVEVAGCPWDTNHRLVRIGLKGWEMPRDERPASNLVFLLDVSGSMTPINKLPLLKKAMKMLAERLNENDRVAIVVYAGASGLVLPSTPGDDRESILEAFAGLESGGSTNGGAGIRLAYDIAVSNFIKDGANRVILATDGDFNVGVTNQGDLVRMIEERAKSGVFLTVLGFGMGNIKDSTLEKLADKGNGNYAYIDTINEARKVLVEEMSSTLVTIAKDVKIQVEFNPAEVKAYRLIGYENRMLRAEDFKDDTKDAGEIGAGHTVTALYEIVPAGAEFEAPSVDPLKYQHVTRLSGAAGSGELLTLKLRYKEPDGETSKLLEFPVFDTGKSFARTGGDFKFGAAVAAFGMLLRDSEHRGNATFSSVLEIAEEGRGEDPYGYRAEFIGLVRKAQKIKGE